MNCERKLTNIFSLISIAAAPGIGVLIAVLFNMGLLPGIVTGVWVAIAVAALLLVGLIIGSATAPSGCLPCRIGSITAAAVGVLFTGVAALIIGLTVGSMLSAVLVGFGAFFFVFLMIQVVNLIICLVSSCRC